MKVALVHELLTMRGGAERVLRVLADMFPDAPVYTFLYKEELFRDWLPQERVIESDLPKRFPYIRNHHLYLRRFPAAAEAWDFSGYDLVISSSSAFGHGIITNGKPKHISYVHSPARYLWDRTHDVLARAGRGPVGWLRRPYLERTFHDLRVWDAEAAGRADIVLAASQEVQRRCQLYWRRESEVLYPPVDDFWFRESAVGPAAAPYYLIVSTLVPYKRIDVAIQACNWLKVPLKIAGDGPYHRKLKAIAGPTVEFLGYTDTAKLKELYSNAKAVLFPGHEDFGLVPVEAAACGTPCIAYRDGGALETIIEGRTGEFFDEPTAESLAAAIKRFEGLSYSKEACREQAKHFGRARFQEGIRAAIGKLTP
jgi:glycosyltransferase involved in cell wall biosynthesis